MRSLTPSELVSLTEMLNMEISGLVGLKMIEPLISDGQLKTACHTGIASTEGRIRGIQQFIQENQVINMREVQ